MARYIQTGEFGLWKETGDLNDVIKEAAELSLGLGENLGRHIDGSDFPHKDLSIFAAACALATAVTGDPVASPHMGNLAASVTIMKKGTGTASPEELMKAAMGRE